MPAGRGDSEPTPPPDATQERVGDAILPFSFETDAAMRAEPVQVAETAGHGDPALFLLFAMAGSLGVVGLRLMEGGAAVAAALAGAMLLGFAGLAWQRPMARRLPEQLGQRCVLLGLLYGIAGIAAVLIALEAASPGLRGMPLDRMLAEFGMALTPALLGLALRILLLQAGPDPVPQAAARDGGLRDRTAELENQVALAVAELERFRLRTQQVLGERLSRNNEAFAEQARAQADAIADLTAGLIQRIDASLLAYAERTDALGAASVALTERIAGSAEAAAEAEARRAAALDRAVASMAETEARMQAIAVRLGEATSTLAQGVAGVVLLGKALPAAATAAETLRVALEEQAEALHRIAVSSAEDAQAVRVQRDRLLADLDASREALGHTQRTLTEVAQAVADRLGG